MRLNRTLLIISILAFLALIVVILAIFLPSRTKFVNLDIIITDENNNFQLETGEKLEFTVNDTLAFDKANMLWEFGNGDTVRSRNTVEYMYDKEGEYLVTLTVDGKFEVPKYIKVTGVKNDRAIDSVPRIIGVDRGYVNEELVFLCNTPGIKSWYWEFGETGTVDAYESQVIYTYKNPGTYRVRLETDQSSFPVYHEIRILPLFNAITARSVDSLEIVGNDIKKHLQAIADASVSSTKTFYNHLKYLENRYKCPNDDMVFIVNGDKYNDLYSYCQGLHFLGGKGSKSIEISKVVVDTVRCIRKVEVTQTLVKK